MGGSTGVHCKLTNNPPSTNNEAPVIYFAILLARKTIGPDISSGAMTRIRTWTWVIQLDKFTSESAESCSFNHGLTLLVIREVFLVDICVYSSWKNGIRPYVVFSKSDCTALHQRQNSRLGWGVVAGIGL
jgi:hypothetical protein